MGFVLNVVVSFLSTDLHLFVQRAVHFGPGIMKKQPEQR
jgi:hypothetical protein